jgi:ABC-type uncharacterized transport system permease subunit
MSKIGSRHTPTESLLIIGALSILFFVLSGISVFTKGIIGILISFTGGFGIGLIGVTCRKTRPSKIWTAGLVGSFIGAGLAILVIRTISFQENNIFNQWTLFTLPISATCGASLASFERVSRIVERFLFTD